MNYPHSPRRSPQFAPSPESFYYATAAYNPPTTNRDLVESPLPEVVTAELRTSPLRFGSSPASAAGASSTALPRCDIEKSEPLPSTIAPTVRSRRSLLLLTRRQLWILLAVILVVFIGLAAGLAVVLSRRGQNGDVSAVPAPGTTVTPQPPSGSSIPGSSDALDGPGCKFAAPAHLPRCAGH